jgi:GAF domain-containing protein
MADRSKATPNVLVPETTPPQRGELQRIRAANATLNAVIKTLGASLDLERVLAGIVGLVSDATACHGCFIYSLEQNQLVLRSASNQYRNLVGNLVIGTDEGLVGWVARTGRPEFIREEALEDARMKIVPELKEERYQSLVAVPIPGRDGQTIGIISLHTVAPREFEPDVLDFLVSIAALVGGAIENAQAYAASRQRVDELTTLAAISERIAAANNEDDLCELAVIGARDLIALSACHLYRADPDGGPLTLAASDSSDGSATPLRSLDPSAATVDPPRAGELVAPLVVAGETRGALLATLAEPIAQRGEDRELLRAVANLVAIALERTALIERLAAGNSVMQIAEALRSGDLVTAETTAAAVGVDLSRPTALIVATATEPKILFDQDGLVARDSRARSPLRFADLGRALLTEFPGALCDFSARTLLAIIPCEQEHAADAIHSRSRPIATEYAAALGIGPIVDQLEAFPDALNDATAAAWVAAHLHRDGGATADHEMGPYRLLARLDLAAIEGDRLYVAIEQIARYDYQHASRTNLLLTLECYLDEGRRVTATARALFVHPNTLRQRLARIEALTGLGLATEDQLSLELALKLGRLRFGISA